MKIGETTPVPSTPVAREQSAGDTVKAPERIGRSPRDSTSIMGIPAEEITPRVQTAVMTLMGEIDKLKRDLENSRKRLRELEDVADQDPLVPLLNRRAFERELGRAQSYIQRYGGDATLVYLDLDDFKNVNDLHGHATGDAVLKQVADLLLENTRQSDIVGRIGGDEFAVILMQTGVEFARAKAASLIAAIGENPVEHDGHSIKMSASAGVSSVNDAEDAATAMARADLAMYEDKFKLDA
jgi:diguanylate cyclase (GGDEF)-like protein